MRKKQTRKGPAFSEPCGGSSDVVVRVTGLEPARCYPPEPKSGMSTNSIIPAYRLEFLLTHYSEFSAECQWNSFFDEINTVLCIDETGKLR